MDIALAKRRENIAEYILYLWQIEDLLRALQFSPEARYCAHRSARNRRGTTPQLPALVHGHRQPAARRGQRGKGTPGAQTLHLIGDLNDLQLQLMKLPIGEHYRQTFAKLEPELPRLRAVLGREMSDIELCFRALYAAMLYRIKGEGGKERRERHHRIRFSRHRRTGRHVRQGRTGRGGPLQRHGTGTVTDRKTRDESGLCGVAPGTKKKKNLRYFWQIKKKIIHLHSALYAKTIKTR